MSVCMACEFLSVYACARNSLFVYLHQQLVYTHNIYIVYIKVYIYVHTHIYVKI